MGFFEIQIYLELTYKSIYSFRFLYVFLKNYKKYAVILYYNKMLVLGHEIWFLYNLPTRKR